MLAIFARVLTHPSSIDFIPEIYYNFIRYRLTQFEPIAAVDIKYVVALVDLAIERIEYETVRAQFFRRDPVDALVVLVTLLAVLVLTVLAGTIKCGVCNVTFDINRNSCGSLKKKKKKKKSISGVGISDS